MEAGADSGARRPGRLALLFGVLAIVLWQSVFYRHGDPETTLASEYRLTASTGVQPWQPEFVYFLYYLNLYPIVPLPADRHSTEPLEYSVEGARRMIAEQGQRLAMDRYWTVRYGELAKTYLYLPHAWLKGRPVKLRMLPANALGFTLALVALFSAFWYVGDVWLGAILVVLMGSNPFQVNQVYANNNLFGWAISLTLMILALHVPLTYGRWRHAGGGLALALASGLLLGTFRQIRTEPVLVAGAVALVYLTAAQLRSWLRVALVVVLGITFSVTASNWTNYFESKYREAWRVVKQAGGHTYDGTRQQHHFFWHALWCGLGDFDRKYGYQWSDVKAFSYAWPILQRRGYVPKGYPLTAPDDCCDILTFGVYWDEGRVYAHTPQELPEYIGIVRDKMLRDIRFDPIWYATILLQRAERVLAQSTPPSVALGNGWSASLPGRAVWGALLVAVAGTLLWLRDWRGLKLIGFTLPLAATPLLVYSDHGVALYSIAHLVAFAIVLRTAPRLWTVAPRSWRWVAERLQHALRRGQRSGPDADRSAASPLILHIGPRVVVVGLLALIVALVWLLGSNRLTTQITSSAAVSVAILRFENATSSEQLTWVGDALGELLTAELARAGARVLGPERVENLDSDLVWWGPFSVLNGTAQFAVNVVADRSSIEQAVVGRVSGSKRGLEACAELRTPGAGHRTPAASCAAVNPERIFETAAQLARPLLQQMRLAPVQGAEFRSAQAYRRYSEAIGAARRDLWDDAERLLDEALQLDPQLTPARLLRARERARFEPLASSVLRGLTGTSDLAAALRAMRDAVRTRPDSVAERIDLGRTLLALELYDEATSALDPLRAVPGIPPDALGLLAEVRSAMGDLAGGYLVALESQRRSRLEPRHQGYFADQLVRWNRLEQAFAEVEEEEVVCAHPGLSNCIDKQRTGRGLAAEALEDLVRQWRVHALRGEWRATNEDVSRMLGVNDPFSDWVGGLYAATGHLFEGRSRLAAAVAEESAFRLARSGQDASLAIRIAGEIRLARGDAAGALAALRLRSAVRSSDPRLLALEALALARAGRSDEALATRSTLVAVAVEWPGPIARRALHQLDGELALLRQDPRGAVQAFSEAERLLSPRGFCGDHVPIWYGLGRAQLAARNPSQAELWFHRVSSATFERLCWPIPYAHATARLGQLRAASHRADEAAVSFERFLSLWDNADLAEDELGEARAFLEANSGAGRPRVANRGEP